MIIIPNNIFFKIVNRTLFFRTKKKQHTHCTQMAYPMTQVKEKPFPGYERVRLIKKQTQKGREYFLCFVDFEDAQYAAIAMQTIQGYHFDKSDKVGLKISFANNPKDRQDKKK
ncbi:hypothetical protein pb186bvf_018983 [Paramecium bursaria]